MTPSIEETAGPIEEWGRVPGGVIYSLNPIDQGRLLAVGFHHLLQRLVAADVPVILLAFPRFVHEPAYIFEKLRSVLPPELDQATAIAAHGRVAERAKVRVGAELRANAPHSAQVVRYEDAETLDAVAMRRELTRMRGELAVARSSVVRLETEVKAHHDLQDRVIAAESARDSAYANTAQALRAGAEAADAIRPNSLDLICGLTSSTG